MDRISAAEVLFSKTQQRLLRALFALPTSSAGVSYSELLRMTSAGAGGIHRELQQFVRAGLVRARPVGGRRFYFPNEAHPIYEELRDIARKLLGIPALVKEALEPFSTQIERAFIYGSVARNAEDAESDIDVMVIGTPPMEKVLGALSQELEPALRRHISARFYDPVEFHQLGASNAFLRRVQDGATIELIEHAPLSKPRRQKKKTPARDKTIQALARSLNARTELMPALTQSTRSAATSSTIRPMGAAVSAKELSALVGALEEILEPARKLLASEPDPAGAKKESGRLLRR